MDFDPDPERQEESGPPEETAEKNFQTEGVGWKNMEMESPQEQAAGENFMDDANDTSESGSESEELIATQKVPGDSPVQLTEIAPSYGDAVEGVQDVDISPELTGREACEMEETEEVSETASSEILLQTSPNTPSEADAGRSELEKELDKSASDEESENIRVNDDTSTPRASCRSSTVERFSPVETGEVCGNDSGNFMEAGDLPDADNNGNSLQTERENTAMDENVSEPELSERSGGQSPNLRNNEAEIMDNLTEVGHENKTVDNFSSPPDSEITMEPGQDDVTDENKNVDNFSSPSDSEINMEPGQDDVTAENKNVDNFNSPPDNRITMQPGQDDVTDENKNVDNFSSSSDSEITMQPGQDDVTDENKNEDNFSSPPDNRITMQPGQDDVTDENVSADSSGDRRLKEKPTLGTDNGSRDHDCSGTSAGTDRKKSTKDGCEKRNQESDSKVKSCDSKKQVIKKEKGKEGKKNDRKNSIKNDAKEQPSKHQQKKRRAQMRKKGSRHQASKSADKAAAAAGDLSSDGMESSGESDEDIEDDGSEDDEIESETEKRSKDAGNSKAKDSSKSVYGNPADCQKTAVGKTLVYARDSSHGTSGRSGSDTEKTSGITSGETSGETSVKTSGGPSQDHPAGSGSEEAKNKTLLEIANTGKQRNPETGSISDPGMTHEGSSQGTASNESKGETSNVQTPKPTRKLGVIFHVALSPDFSSCIDDYDLRITFFSGRFHYKTWPMNIDHKSFGGLTMCSLKVDFEHGDFIRKDIEYKYQFVLKGKDEKPHYEQSHLSSNLSNRQMNNRSILQAYERKKLSPGDFIWHQFDGITRPPKTFADKLGALFSRLKAVFISNSNPNWLVDYVNLIQALMPSWKGLCIDPNHAAPGKAEDALEEADHVYHCIINYFLNNNGRKFLELETQKLVRDYMGTLLEGIQADLLHFDGCKQKSRFGLATFVSIVHIMRTCGIQLDVHLVEVVCQGLLLKPDYERRTCPDFEELLSVHFKNTHEQVTKSLLDFINKDVSRVTSQWILALPLVHFLCKSSKPFGDLSHIQEDYNHKTWWGETMISDAKHNLHSKYPSIPQQRNLCSMIQKQLEPLFVVDQLLPRTLLALMELEDVLKILPVVKFPVNARIVNIRYFVLTCNSFNYYPGPPNTEKLMKIANLMRPLVQRIEEEAVGLADNEDEDIERQLDYSWELNQISRDLLDATCNVASTYSSCYEAVAWAAEVFIASLNYLCQLINLPVAERKFVSMQKDLPSAADLLGIGKESIRKWLVRCFSRSMDDSSTVLARFQYEWELRCLCSLMKLEGKLWDEKLKTDWSESFRSHLISRITKMKPEAIVELTGVHDFSVYDYPSVEEIFNQCAFEAADKVCKDMNLDTFVLHIDRHPGSSKLFRFLPKLFLRTLPELADDESAVLRHILSRPSFVQFLKLFGKLPEDSKRECWEQLVLRMSKLDEVLRKLVNGNITVQDLSLLLKPNHRKQLLEITSMGKERCFSLAIDSMPGASAIEAILEWRRRERDEYLQQLHLLRFFSGCCTDAKSEAVAGLGKLLDISVDEVLLDKVCEPRMLDASNPNDLIDFTTYHPTISSFALSRQTLTILKELQKLYESQLFRGIWKNFVTQLTDDTGSDSNEEENEETGDNEDIEAYEDDPEDRSSVEEEIPPATFYNEVVGRVIVNVWKPSQVKWKELCGKIVSGQITVEHMQKVFKALGKDHRKLETELKFIAKERLIINERLEQIELLEKVNEVKYGAKVVLKAQREFNIQGDFSDLEILVDTEHSKLMPLSSISRTLLNRVESLQQISDEQSRCLDAFLKNKVLIDWLRETVELRELGTFIDLALIAATDEGAVQVEYVTCLDAVVKGFAPFIYRIDQNMSYDNFLELCSEVWDSLKAAPDLPEKLAEAARNLDFLKQIQESHGSGEDSAISVMKFINQTGVFSVGHHEGKSFRELADVITATYFKEQPNCEGGLPQSPTRKETKTMNLKNLTDLNNKLMLIVGRNEAIKLEAEQFGKVFDGILRLGKTYSKLCMSGCMLFHKWKAVFDCDPTKKNNTYVDFSDDGVTLKSREKDVTRQIQDVCQFMEACLDEWLKYVEEQREEFRYLNLFTAQQLMILQRGLSKIRNDSKAGCLSSELFSLLSLVKKDCTEYDLFYSFSVGLKEEKKEEGGDEEMERDDDSLEEEEEEHPDRDPEDGDRLAFVEAMVESSFSQALALKALESGIDPAAIEEGILWCMDNQDLEESLAMYREASCEEIRGESMESSSASTEVWSELDLPRMEPLAAMTSSLLQNLTTSNNSLLDKLHTFWKGFLGQTTESFTDCLSLKHLGLILENLAKVIDEAEAFERPVLTYLKTNQPNLIVCNKSDVLSVVLSVYSFSDGAKMPLPGVDEVLLCSANTTAEDVELLFRRAAANKNKIYSLVFADLLDYNVACHVEDQMLHLFPASKTNDLRLVVICCCEHEVRSNIVSALDRYRVHVPQQDINEYKAYLKGHFTVKSVGKLGVCGVPASHVDPEFCSVRVIQSFRSGVGKTLRVKRLKQALQRKLKHYTDDVLVLISLHSKTVNHSEVVRKLFDSTRREDSNCPRIFHLDIAPEVQEGVDHLLFSLLVLGCLTDENGYVWRRRNCDLYLVECMPLTTKTTTPTVKRRLGFRTPQRWQLVHQIFSLLPSITCWSPQDSLDIMNERTTEVEYRHPECQIGGFDQLVDEEEFSSEELQRPFQYLKQFSSNQVVRKIPRIQRQGTALECTECLLRHCGVLDPSWSELHNFASFLNVQLKDCENSFFCSDFLSDDLPGLLTFVVKFMIRMSKDFATRSLKISEESPGYTASSRVLLGNEGTEEVGGEGLLQGYSLKRRWETSPHPYLFFNNDHHSLTFMGFVMDRHSQNLLDPQTREILERQIMPQNLHHALFRNNVNLQENFEDLPRSMKIEKLCSVMGQDCPHDPDETYELTGDNVKKILAIFMRFRCNIPVIIMGETGCGKTRLVKFMCDLWRLPGDETENMILMKMHGGTTEEDITRCLERAIAVAEANRKRKEKFGTVLFFDEANTTEAIGLIKEIMCDHTCNGKPLPDALGLHLIAACNPYRKHSDVMIDRLEQAGLGYRVRADQTRDKLGYIPMRQLVYRVQALPQSMLPLVWDFGQLSDEVESLYIRQMVNRHLKDLLQSASSKSSFEGPFQRAAVQIPTHGLEETVSRVLAASQVFMRHQKDECSFVSLRDVERALKVMIWFYNNGELLFGLMNETADLRLKEVDYLDEEDSPHYQAPNKHTRSLILALGVCYHACLQDRDVYRNVISTYFQPPCTLPEGAKTILDEINLCQDVFLENVGKLDDNIARNKALKENVLMMVVCIELRIPLFLVGKPGSSKSLAKTIVGNAMLGKASVSPLFKNLKSVHMVSFQCSPLSTPDGIIGTFAQCAQLQKGKVLEKHAAVVVLDEVGLAEDSPKMPLKTLHPLLEYGCEVDGRVEPHSKVGFIGISNWALDPAKMNRGILVLREVPDEDELLNSASGICADEQRHQMTAFMRPLTAAYKELYDRMQQGKREFFGLRDFYSLIKMVCAFCKKSGEEPTWYELKHAILRNFDGLSDSRALEIFEKHLAAYKSSAKPPLPGDPDCSSSALIKASLHGIGLDSESRYLLILTVNYIALGLLQQELEDLRNAVTIFGSSFPKDQEYIQVCRNINRIKTCMENGRTVVLLNLENLYESLYDALNQYYMYFNKQRFVDLGLGTQRVKCKVHTEFRLIVVAEKNVVYEKFPIPLINRLEKHILSMDTMLTDDQKRLVKALESWARDFCDVGNSDVANKSQATVGDVFIGYHPDTAASVILHLWKVQMASEKMAEATKKEILRLSKAVLMQCATPDSLIRLSRSRLAADTENLRHQYFVEQCHSNLAELLMREMSACRSATDAVFLQVTTHSLLLSRSDLAELSAAVGVRQQDIHLHSLQGFDTEQQFCSLLQEVFRQPTEDPSGAILYIARETDSEPLRTPVNRLFILQCDSGDANAELIACARYNVFNEYTQAFENQLDNRRHQVAQIHIVFVIQLPRVPGGCFAGFQGGKWKCFHLDELLPAKEYLPKLSTLMQLQVSELIQQTISMETRSHLEDLHRSVSMETHSHLDHRHHSSLNRYGKPEKDAEALVENVEAVSKRAAGALEGMEVPPGRGCEAIQEIEQDLSRFNVELLILNCLHRAAALLKDADGSGRRNVDSDRRNVDSRKDFDSSNRKIYRLNLLLKLLKQSNKDQGLTSLMNMIKKRLGHLLIDKETAHQTPQQARSWLMEEVSSLEATAKAGTFRRALLQTLEGKVTPLLSGIIAYVDRNANLDLVEDVSSWKQKLWLEMLGREEVTSFRYRDLNSPEHHNQTGLPEFQVLNTGFDGKFFKCSFPFSWVVKDQIDCLLHQTKKTGKSLDGVIPLLESTELGSVLQSTVDADTLPEAVDAYMTDFAQMVFKSSSSSDGEVKWVTEDLRQTMASSSLDQEYSTSGSLLVQFVDLHKALEVSRPRLRLFAELLRIWPECRVFLGERRGPPLPLDLKMLVLILENLIPPDSKSLDNPDQQRGWSKTVDLFSPLIRQLIESIHLIAGDAAQQQHFEKCCQMWNQLHAVNLFIKRVCLSKVVEPKLVFGNCGRLFQLLKDKADFRQIATFKRFESFLTACNKQATKFYIDLGNCGHCGKPLENPVGLPCGHSICLECVSEMKHLVLSVCPHEGCNATVPEDLPIQPLKTKSEEVAAHNEYRRCLNCFFMEVIHSLCFLRNSPPTTEVIQELMEYVTLGAKETFEERADPSPVVRSFVLQILLQSRIDDVRGYLDEFFMKAHKTLKSTSEETTELCVLIVNCLEDYYRSMSMRRNTLADQIRLALEILDRTEGCDLVISETPTAGELESIGKIRFLLNQTAKWIVGVEIKEELSFQEVWPFLRKMEHYLEAKNSKWMRMYLMRVIIKGYGLEVLKQLSDIHRVHWVVAPEVKKEFEKSNGIPDKFLVYGDDYRSIRNLVAETALGRSAENLTHQLQNAKKDDKLYGQVLLLAVYRSLTLNYRHSEELRPSEKAKKALLEICQPLPCMKNHEELLKELIENGLPGSLLKISSDDSTVKLTLSELMAHFYVVMCSVKERKIHSPFASLIFSPAQLQNSLFPTMPQDDIERLQSAVAQGDKGMAAVYQCPNGHPYLIGDCGNPNFERLCPECGEEIGGLQHKPKPGNVKVDKIVDQTQRGHCLGPAHLRSATPSPERDLTPAATELMRLMLHMSLYIASTSHAAEICGLVIPKIPENHLEKYFHQHMKVDLRLIGTAVGRNEDDVYLLVHLLLRQMALRNAPKPGPQSLPLLSTKNSRQEWENIYSRTYITPVLEMMNAREFNEIHETIRKDDNLLGNSPLFRLLFESDLVPGDNDAERVETVAHLWRFRTQISMENLTVQLSDDVTDDRLQRKHEILRLFLREQHRLRFLRYLPRIVRLNELMMQHILHQPNKDAASKWTFGSKEFQESFSGSQAHRFEEIEDLVKDFAFVWKALRQNFTNFVFAVDQRLSQEQSSQLIDGTTRILSFLPSIRGDGLLSVAMVSYLCNIQNQFMEEYSRLSHQSLESCVDVGEASVAQVIAISEQDVLPLLLANCAYSLKAGEGTIIHYDFASLEKQIEERFFRGKPRIRAYQVDELAMLDDTSYVTLFEKLRQRIRQTPMTMQLKTDLEAIRKDYTLLNRLIADLDTALGYLAYVGGRPNDSLQDFMTNVLKMPVKLKTTKVHVIHLKHFESLWLTLAFMKAKLDIKFDVDPFLAVEEKYREELTEEMVAELESSLRKAKDLDLLVMTLFECILFQMTVRKSESVFSNYDEELGLILDAYMEQKGSNSTRWSFPSEIKVRHCVAAWKHLLKFQPAQGNH